MRLYFKGTVSLLGIAGMLPMLHSSKLQVTGQVLQIQLVVTGSVASFNFFALPLQARKWGCMPNLERKGYTQLTVDYTIPAQNQQWSMPNPCNILLLELLRGYPQEYFRTVPNYTSTYPQA
mmetsp:Transcript_10243/g.25108  ORF Transcript_10243/g.25108 Transcript_10243/m.25108 type:complete len:121 (+) Transcript_10243:1407-1769(+)